MLRCLAEADLAPATVVALVTVHGKRGQHGLLAAAEAVGAPVWAYPAARLAAVRVPCPSPTVASAVGTPSVAEAAALLAAGAGGRLLVAKRSSVPERPGPAAATCAIAVPPAG